MEKRLGKGLEALISEDAGKMLKEEKGKGKEKVEKIRLADIVPNPFQPRKTFEEEKMDDLMSSIREKGVIQPVIVRPSSEGFELIAGERRWRAAKKAGLEDIPALIRPDIDDASSLEISIIENIQREELNPVEEAEGYKELIDKFEYTLDKVGQMVGKDKSTISNSLRLLALPEDIRSYLVKGQLSTGHAKAILSVSSDNKKRSIARTVIAKGLSVREAEILAKRITEPALKTKKAKLPEVVEIENRLRHRLATKVNIIQGKKRGRIEIQYFSPKDLERLLGIIIGPGEE